MIILGFDWAANCFTYRYSNIAFKVGNYVVPNYGVGKTICEARENYLNLLCKLDHKLAKVGLNRREQEGVFSPKIVWEPKKVEKRKDNKRDTTF